MQFQTLTFLLATAMAVSATPLSSRQVAPGQVTARYYDSPTGDQGCRDGDFSGVTQTFVQDTPGVCHNITTFTVVTSEKFVDSTLTRTLRFYNKPCGQLASANSIDVGPGQTGLGCNSNVLASWVTL